MWRDLSWRFCDFVYDHVRVLSMVLLMLVGIITSVALSAVIAFPLMGLWNWLMPDLFQLPAITWLQAFGLLLLAWCLRFNVSFSTDSKKQADAA